MNGKNNMCINNILTPKSYWLDSTDETNYPTLEKDIKVDIAIIGGGITGITTALLLKNEGYKVALIEADKIVQGTTGHTTAYVTSQHDIIYSNLINTMGIKKAKQYADANEGAIDFIENMVKEYDIDCDFCRLPAYIYTTDESYKDTIKEEAEAAKSLGIKAKYIEKLDLPFSISGALCFENQAQFHPRKYLLKMAENISGNGSQIYEHTRAVDIKHDNLYTVITDTGFKVIASKVVLASHFPFYDGLGLYFAKLRPQRSYVISAIIKDALPNGTFVDSGEAGWYFRSQKYKDGQMIIIGGQEHKTAHGGDMIKHYVNLKNYAEKNFNVENFLYRWSTQDYITIDGVPYVGKLTSTSENIYVATGYGEWGMTNGTAAATILRDIIVKNESPYQEVYNPSRKILTDGIKNLVKENFDVAKQLIKGKLQVGQYNFDLKNDQGKIVEIDGERYGAYRDKHGELHIVDITCTHLGCELKWNSEEKSWDCPCHGSRFSFEGDIIEGPAVCRLNHYKESDNTIDSNII
ncbi:FAD-dependent oxidoreductase [Clostridium estertheticum]|uniref:(2Fe-2S)-binding protein n=1 Tax=Clostridium estertheticum subsp. estertheticum TaxID=1552 RepID=A0A1J0GIU1_9CLOT|nr:FAD-dependent oxidoreductase [Clostridium estertheticum]APC41241.1 (2Fe-2S)-binding protein [Clostridium estertheticum subsp. estertheticum]MBZ9616931.1 FAD-dependent oxidoreductase [Clostridium estertheticum subsp. laramiense]WAG72633.1 FAD-dependent oxidoreductase [Clostridium estertheticum]